MKIVNNNAPEVLVQLAKKWHEEGKSFYLGPENIFHYNCQPINYAGAEKVSRNIGDWSIHTSDCAVPKFHTLKKEEVEEIAYAFSVNALRPKLAFLTLNYKCNAACGCCPYHGTESSYYKNNFKSDQITIDLNTAKQWVDKVFDIMEGGSVFLGSDGELFLIPYWEEIMSYVVKKGLRQFFTTNGTFFTPELIEKLVGFGNIDTIKFSLHALDFDTWSAFTNIKNRKLYENAMQAPILAKKAGIQNVYINFVKTEVNAHQVKDFIDYWSDKVSGVFISHALNAEESLSNYYDQFNEPVGVCEAYSSIIYVLPSGTVIPCCPAATYYNDKDKYSLPYANFNEHSAEEILHMMRESVKNDKFKTMCAHCVQYSRRGAIPAKINCYGYDASLNGSICAYINFSNKNTIPPKKIGVFTRLKDKFQRL
jgi:MoaA/NifB/PqqE/SkfB family radical SAM enzyme